MALCARLLGLLFVIVATPAYGEGTRLDFDRTATDQQRPTYRSELSLTSGLEPVRGDPSKAVILIFSHGTERPDDRHNCDRRRDIPDVVRRLDSDPWQVVYLCSRATDGAQTGSYTFKRAREIRAAVRYYRDQGVPARQIFLLGHSAGGWSSLLAAREYDATFNAVIAFAPAFAGPRNETRLHPRWRREIRRNQIAYLTRARRIDALVFAFPDDPYNRPSDLGFLRRIPGVHLRTVTACFGGHGTPYRNCFVNEALSGIRSFIENRLPRAYNR